MTFENNAFVKFYFRSLESSYTHVPLTISQWLGCIAKYGHFRVKGFGVKVDALPYTFSYGHKTCCGRLYGSQQLPYRKFFTLDHPSWSFDPLTLATTPQNSQIWQNWHKIKGKIVLFRERFDQKSFTWWRFVAHKQIKLCYNRHLVPSLTVLSGTKNVWICGIMHFGPLEGVPSESKIPPFTWIFKIARTNSRHPKPHCYIRDT